LRTVRLRALPLLLSPLLSLLPSLLLSLLPSLPRLASFGSALRVV
jgi:hypothetical protein